MEIITNLTIYEVINIRISLHTLHRCVCVKATTHTPLRYLLACVRTKSSRREILHGFRHLLCRFRYLLILCVCVTRYFSLLFLFRDKLIFSSLWTDRYEQSRF